MCKEIGKFGDFVWFYRIILVASQSMFGWVWFCWRNLDQWILSISKVLVTALQTASGLGGHLWIWSQSVLFLLSLLPLCYNWSIIHWSLSLGGCVSIEWFVVTAWVGQLELNAQKTFECTGRRFCCLMLFMSTVPHDEALPTVSLQYGTTRCVSVKPFWTSAASHDSASFRTLQHSALSLQQLDQ